MPVRIIGIGRKTGGDDGAGPAVIQWLRQEKRQENIELLEVGEPSALLPLLEQSERVIIVDAALISDTPGTVHVVRPDDLETCPLTSVSTHGMSVGQAIALARVLEPEKVCPDIHLVAIAAQKPNGVVLGLSPEVGAAIEGAAMVAWNLAQPTENRLHHA